MATRCTAQLLPRVAYGAEQRMAIDAHRTAGRQLVEGALTTHRTALPHRASLMVALNPLSARRSIRPEAAGAQAMAASGCG